MGASEERSDEGVTVISSQDSCKPPAPVPPLKTGQLTLSRNHNALLPPSASAWIRRQLAESLRSRKPYAVNLLLGG